MLLQIPVMVGLYTALSSAIELRHAPFISWIQDLSAPDCLPVAGFCVPVLVVLMGVTMLVQQWMTPAQADPAQQRVMMLMPVVFAFMFRTMPAGLLVYWTVLNVLTIAQQYWTTRAQT